MEDSWLVMLAMLAILVFIVRVAFWFSAGKRVLQSLLAQRNDALAALQKQLTDARSRGQALGSDEKAAMSASWQQMLQLQQQIAESSSAASMRQRELASAQAARSAAFEHQQASIKAEAAAHGLFL
jgi:hypothetical protein